MRLRLIWALGNQSLSGCFTLSQVWNCFLVWEKGEKTAWKIWNAFPAVTDVFYALANPPVDVTDYVMAPLKRFVIYLYDKTCNLSDINEAQQYLFCQKTWDIENIPATKAVPLQHTLRAVYQACYIWARHLCHLRYYQIHQSGDGSRRKGYGSQTGRYFRR